jgi:hypothetical protein
VSPERRPSTFSPRAEALSLLAAAVLAPAAAAHGPCGCLQPDAGPPGTRVAADVRGYKVVFNPDRADLGIGPEELWDAHHGPAPVTVMRRPWAYERRYPRASFVVPSGTPPGRYLVALYDGGEGGAHYTWESFTVTGAAAGPADRPQHDDEPIDWPVWIAAAAGLVLGAAGGIGVARRYFRQ